MSAELYIKQSEPAVRHLFDGLNTYDSIPLPSIMDYVDESGLVKMTKYENKDFLEAYDQYFELEFARASLAGSILQLAYVGDKEILACDDRQPKVLGIGCQRCKCRCNILYRKRYQGNP